MEIKGKEEKGKGIKKGKKRETEQEGRKISTSVDQ